MSNAKIKIEINLETWTKIKKMYEESRMNYEKIGINNVDEFINYIINHFSNSSEQFEKMNDSVKQLMENINIDNLNLEDLFKSIVETSKKKENNNNNNNGNDNNKKS